MNPVIWTKCENDGSFSSPELGGAWTKTGTPTYSAARWNNGVLSKNSNCQSINLAVGLQKFSYTFSVKMAYASNVASGFLHDVIGGYSAFLCDGTHLNVNIGSVPAYPRGSIPYLFDLVPWSAGDNVAFAVVFDASAAAGSKIKVYQNKTELNLASYTEYSGGDWSDAGLPVNVRLGYVDYNNLIDNFKYYEDVITATEIDWDADNEELKPVVTPVPQNFSATDNLISKVTCTWDAVAGASPEYQVHRATSSGGSFADISGWISDITYDDITMDDDVVYWYKVKARIGTTEGLFSDEDAGHGISGVLGDSYPIKTKNLETHNTKIMVGNIDLWQKEMVDKFPIIEYYKSFDRDRVFINQINIQTKNIDNFFSIDNNKSIYKDINWRGQDVKLYDPDSVLIWAGKLFNILRDYKSGTATIVSNNSLYEDRYSKIEYTSADWETGADAVKNIFIAYGITNYDENSFNQSIGILTEAGVYLKATYVSSDNKNLIEVIEEIAKYSNADIFDYKGNIYFTVWKNTSLILPITSIDDDDILDPPKIEIMDKLIKNDYSIAYTGDGGVPATDLLNNNIGLLSRTRNGIYSFEMTGGTNIVLKDLTSAVWIGEQAMKRTHRDFSINPRGLAHYAFSISMDAGSWFDLYTVFKMTFSQEDWVNKLFEIYKLGLDYEKRIITLEVFELGS
jgi:hypothetical protein